MGVVVYYRVYLGAFLEEGVLNSTHGHEDYGLIFVVTRRGQLLLFREPHIG